ncbi:MAG TPA: molybdopterin-binding protein, partial [Thermomicrobiales bacterium]|nr:molybdopterin-binding protein [Thermomicrobiales bacterium]
CAAAGIDLVRVTQVGDDLASILASLRLALEEADIVICTGGVGPTDDDLTREAITSLAGETPEIDPNLLRDLKAFFANRGQEMPERNAKQAWVLPSGRVLPNPIGTAPGWLVTIDRDDLNGTVIAMPGVPREMYRMWEEQALPAIQEQIGGHVIRSATLKTLGIGESAAEDQIHDLIVRQQPVIATYAKDDGVHIRITVVDDSAHRAERQLEASISEVEAILGRHIWGRDSERLPVVLLGAFERTKTTIAIAERGSGGALAGLLTSVPSEDQTHPLLEARVLPLDFDLDQEAAIERARAMAARMRSETGAAIGLAIVVFGGFDERKVLHGTAAVAIESERSGREVTFVGIRSAIEDAHRRAALHAADRLRQLLTAPESMETP